MALKSYSFKTREEAVDLEKAVKKLFKKKTPMMADFRNEICKLCPHKCRTCLFCWGIFYKFKNTLVDYHAPLTILKVLISGYYDSLYIPTFYFLKENICSVCVRYGQGCNTVAIGDPCPSEYLTQMDSNESARTGIEDEDLYNGFSQYDYANGRTYSGYYYQAGCGFANSVANKSRPKLAVNGEKMQELVNKLFKPVENEQS